MRETIQLLRTKPVEPSFKLAIESQTIPKHVLVHFACSAAASTLAWLPLPRHKLLYFLMVARLYVEGIGSDADRRRAHFDVDNLINSKTWSYQLCAVRACLLEDPNVYEVAWYSIWSECWYLGHQEGIEGTWNEKWGRHDKAAWERYCLTLADRCEEYITLRQHLLALLLKRGDSLVRILQGWQQHLEQTLFETRGR